MTHLLPVEPIETLDHYLATDTGGLGLRRAREIGPEAVVEEVKASGLRGRGGGGFPTGAKWAGIAAQAGETRYVVCNGAEGEPGTFKDRALIRANPYQLVEGLIIAGLAIQAQEVYVCLKASFETEIARLTRAVEEFQLAGICSECTVNIVAGPDEYLFGEEKAMLEVIEGNDPLPRWLPPHLHGLFSPAPQLGWQATRDQAESQGHPHSPSTSDATNVEAGHESNPTLVNNVETFSNVPHILARGADWFRGLGTAESPGTIVATVVGDVVAPDVGEVELGTPLHAVIDAVGSGLPPGRSVKAVFSGVANAVLTPEHLDAPLSYEGLAAAGSGMGAAGFIVYDDTTCMVDVAYHFSRFLSVESCGQCPPCKLGSSAITEHLERIETGEGTVDDIDAIVGWIGHVTDGNRCYLAVEEQTVIRSILEAFPRSSTNTSSRERAPDAASCRCRSSWTSPAAWPPTTRASGASGRTGPTTRN
ncbi:MAG: hypothetical protein M5U19_22235 [Microthrixaceae bacterium]|nr:hypothetical protein [Microthrixaceae bacterium]